MQNTVIIKPHIFDDRDALRFELVSGATINDFIQEAKLPVSLNGHIRASVNGVPVVYDEFSAPLQATDIVNIYVVPMGGGGGKNVLRLVAVIAVIYFAPYAAGFVTLSVGGGATFLAGATMAFTALGMMAVNALIKPPALNTGGYNASNPAQANTYTITGQSNTMSPYGVIPRLYGTHLFFPRLCGQPLVWNSGKSSYFTGLYDFGYAKVKIDNIKIGATSIDSFHTNMNFIPSTKKDGLIYYTSKIDIQNIGVELKYNNEITRETSSDVMTAEIELAFPRGLVHINNKGQYTNKFISLEVLYREAGTSQPFTTKNIQTVGGGVLNSVLSDTLSVQLQIMPGQSSWFPAKEYALVDKKRLIVNTTREIKAGEILSNIVEFEGFWWSSTVGERRTVINNVPIGNGVVLEVDRPFINFTRRISGTDAPKFFASTSVGSVVQNVNIQNNTTDAFTIITKFVFDRPSKYEIKVKRLTQDSTSSSVSDSVTWSLFRSFGTAPVIDLDTEHSLIELNMRATEQINGVVQNLNAITTSELRYWTGVNFSQKYTNNPAWIVLDILTGKANAGAISTDQLDLTSFLSFANYCDETVEVDVENGGNYFQKRHTCNLVISSETTVHDLVQSILSQSRASLKISSNGRYGVLFDVAKSIPVQLFTNRNSSNFSSNRTYADIPHALRVKYVNPLQAYEIDEVIVYGDGYDALTATKFEDLDTFGITDYYEAFRHGRYTLAQIIAYQETFTIEVDLEHLSVQRGELVSVQNDVPRIGGQPLRVKAVLNNGNNIIVNDELVFNGTDEYYYLSRTEENRLIDGKITNVTDGNNVQLEVPNSFIKVGDIFVYGFKDFVTKDYIVNAIIPNTDLKAKLTLTPYNPAVYTADTGLMPEYESGISPEIGDECRVKVQNLTFNYEITYENRRPVPTFNITWEVGSNAQLKEYMIEWASIGLNGVDFMYGDRTSDTAIAFKLPNLVDNPHLLDAQIAIRVTPISRTDKPCIPSSSVAGFVKHKEFPPTNVEFFNINVVSETLNLTWRKVDEPDIDFYVIKYHPSLDQNVATWERSTVLTDSISYDTLRHTTNARKGTYLIKAIDTSGNLSPVASRAITQIPEIVDLNFIEQVRDAESWVGSKQNFVLENGLLKTSAITSEPTCEFTICDGLWRDNKPWSDSIAWEDIPFNYGGTDFSQNARYTFKNFADLTDVYTCRVSVGLDAFAFRNDELMYTWKKLSDLDSLASTSYDDWNVYVVIKTAAQISGMSTWDKMSDVVFLSDGGNSEEWTTEALAEMGDFTGRYFRFYLIAETKDEKVRVSVRDAYINIDMPDRIISENDIESTVGGGRISFSPSFYVTPALGITQDNAQKGDRYVVTNKDSTGFNIEFFDTNDVSVLRQFDFMAKAYGAKAHGTTVLHNYEN